MSETEKERAADLGMDKISYIDKDRIKASTLKITSG